MIKLSDIHWRKGLRLRRWGPKDARNINLLVSRGLVTWSFGQNERYPEHRQCRTWDFGGVHIYLTRKGKIIARRRAT